MLQDEPPAQMNVIDFVPPTRLARVAGATRPNARLHLFVPEPRLVLPYVLRAAELAAA
jgi:hypothetical protein